MRVPYREGRVYQVSGKLLNALVKAKLTPGRRGQVLECMQRGLNSAQIAAKLEVPLAEVLKHSRQILRAGLL